MSEDDDIENVSFSWSNDSDDPKTDSVEPETAVVEKKNEPTTAESEEQTVTVAHPADRRVKSSTIGRLGQKPGRKRPPAKRCGLISTLDLVNSLKLSDDDEPPVDVIETPVKGPSTADTKRKGRPVADSSPGDKKILTFKESTESDIGSDSIDISRTEVDNISFPSDSGSHTPVAPKRRTEVEIFEEATVHRLEQVLDEMKRSFVDEFREMTETAFGIDIIFTRCLDELQDELRQVVNERSFEQARAALTEVSMQPVLDECLYIAARPGTKAGKDPALEADNPHEQLTTKLLGFIENSRARLNEITSESAQVAQLRIQAGGRSMDRRRFLVDELEERSLALVLEKQGVERQALEVRSKLVKEREQGLVWMKEPEDARPSVKEDLEDVIKMIKSRGRSPVSKLTGFTARDTSEIGLMIGQIWVRAARMANPAPMYEQYPRSPVKQSPPRVVIEEPTGCSVYDVKEQLAMIRRQRMETMRRISAGRYDDVA